MTSNIGIVQMNSNSNTLENLEFAKKQIEQGSRNGLDLIAFPETFLYVGTDHQEKHKIAQSLEGKFIQTLQEHALHFRISILLGSLYETVPGDAHHLYNTSVLIDRGGNLVGVYRKIYMCDAPALGYNESKGIKPGDTLVVVDHEVGKIGFSICYDLRFPELYEALTTQGAEIIFVPAAFFLHTGKQHWIPLLTARAIENQVYIVAPNQWGFHYEGRISYGYSVIIDPWGTVLCCAPERPCLVSAIIDLNYLKDVREKMPVLVHKRPKLYKKR
ncbi:MAG: carbon-nitrogen hydrolase family protein [Methylococcales bacterium]